MITDQSSSSKRILDTKREIELYLSDFFDAHIRRAANYDEHYKTLWNNLKLVALAGGKRLRPHMTILAYKACGGTNSKAVLPAAAALEMLHIATLIHDDIIDRELTRHDTANVSGIYTLKYREAIADKTERRHMADSTALVGGDLLLSSAYALIHHSTMPSPQKLMAADILADAIFIVCGGQLLDTESSFRDRQHIDPIKIAQLKTASYSFVSPLRMGASLAGADEDMLLVYEQFGNELGIAFQLADDLLGMFGDEQITGKSSSVDLREGKFTYLIQMALNSAGAEADELQNYLGNRDVGEIELKRARDIILKSGARTHVEEKIAHHVKAAREHLTTLNLAQDLQSDFELLITKSTKRVS